MDKDFLSKKTPGILVFGEIIWDVFPDKACIGGAALNFAAHFADCGGRASMLSAVGKDQLGDDALKETEDFGVGIQWVSRIDYPTGRCDVTLSPEGLPKYNVVWDTSFDHIEYGGDFYKELAEKDYDYLYFGTVSQRGKDSRETLEKLLAEYSFDKIFCDVNLRVNCYDEKSVENCLKYANFLKISDEEEPLLRDIAGYLPAGDVGEAPEALFNKYPQLEAIVITKGSEGASMYRPGGKEVFVPAVKAECVSTVGAGDSFSADWLYSLLTGDDDYTALENGAARAAYVVAFSGAVPPGYEKKTK